MNVAEIPPLLPNESIRLLTSNFGRTSQKDFVTGFSFSSNRKKDNTSLDIPTVELLQ